MSTVPLRTYLFAGGGTGGHIFPALAIAEQLDRLAGAESPARSVFLCSDRAIDRAILEPEGVTFVPLPARPFSVRPSGLVGFMRGWGAAVRLAREQIRTVRGGAGGGARAGARVCLVAMGGFVAAPAVQAARVERVPVVLVNLDAVPGRANRWIAGRSDAAFSTFPVEARWARGWTTVRPIVRRAALADRPRAQCAEALGLDPARPVLAVIGGSQGAGSLNELMPALLERHPGALAGWQVLHQCGPQRAHAGGSTSSGVRARLQEAYARAGATPRVEEFTRQIGLWWGAADLAISRAGAGAVSEAWCAAVPTVFLPYPFHRDQHQARNAEPLRACGGALVLRDRVSGAANAAEHGAAIVALLRDAPRRAAMRAALRRLGPADGAEAIARALLDPGGVLRAP